MIWRLGSGNMPRGLSRKFLSCSSWTAFGSIGQQCQEWVRRVTSHLHSGVRSIIGAGNALNFEMSRCLVSFGEYSVPTRRFSAVVAVRKVSEIEEQDFDQGAMVTPTEKHSLQFPEAEVTKQRRRLQIFFKLCR
jgi:hypothetical protein